MKWNLKRTTTTQMMKKELLLLSSTSCCCHRRLAMMMTWTWSYYYCHRSSSSRRRYERRFFAGNRVNLGSNRGTSSRLSEVGVQSPQGILRRSEYPWESETRPPGFGPSPKCVRRAPTSAPRAAPAETDARVVAAPREALPVDIDGVMIMGLLCVEFGDFARTFLRAPAVRSTFG